MCQLTTAAATLGGLVLAAFLFAATLFDGRPLATPADLRILAPLKIAAAIDLERDRSGSSLVIPIRFPK